MFTAFVFFFVLIVVLPLEAGAKVLAFQAFPVAHLVLWWRAYRSEPKGLRAKAWPALLAAWAVVQAAPFFLKIDPKERLGDWAGLSVMIIGTVKVLPLLLLVSLLAHGLAFAVAVLPQTLRSRAEPPPRSAMPDFVAGWVFAAQSVFSALIAMWTWYWLSRAYFG